MEPLSEILFDYLEPERDQQILRWTASNARTQADSSSPTGTSFLGSPPNMHPLYRYLQEPQSHELRALGLSLSVIDSSFTSAVGYQIDSPSPVGQGGNDGVLVSHQEHQSTESSWSVVGNDDGDPLDHFVNTLEPHEKLALDLSRDPPAAHAVKPLTQQEGGDSPPSSISLDSHADDGYIEPDLNFIDLNVQLAQAGMEPLGTPTPYESWKRVLGPRPGDKPRVRKRTYMRRTSMWHHDDSKSKRGKQKEKEQREEQKEKRVKTPDKTVA